MSYKNFEYIDQYREFLKGALEDLGFRVLDAYHKDFVIVDKNGRDRVINDTIVYFLMGATVETIGKWMDETWRGLEE